MTDAATDLDTRAREAWGMLTRTDEPMPAWAALDYVQEACDDRQACFLALCGVAADELDEFIGTVISRAFGPRAPNSRVGNAARLIRKGVLTDVLVPLDHIQMTPPADRDLNQWDLLWLIFVRVVDALTALEAAK